MFEPTPLQLNAHLSERFGADIWLKREDLTPVRSYKLRGAMNAMRKLPDQKLFVCASAGNHAQPSDKSDITVVRIAQIWAQAACQSSLFQFAIRYHGS